MTQEMLLLIVVGVIFLLSLVGAIVLFKFLKSTAMIKNPRYRAGGALAGFLLIYGTMYYSFDRMEKSEISGEPTLWTISGIVRLEKQIKHDGAVVKHVPAKPFSLTDATGQFRLENVRMFKNEGMPEIAIENDGYFPRSFEIADTNSNIDQARKMIRIRDTLELTRVVE